MLLLFVGMTSCNKEEITIEDPEIIFDPPEEIEYPIAKGIVKDEDGTLANAKVAVYQLGDLKGETFSNADGEYTTIGIETIFGEDLIIKFSKEEYNSSYRKRSKEVLKNSFLDVELTTNDNDIDTEPLIDGIFEYISFSGYIKDLDGNPNDAKISAFLQSPYLDEDGSTYIVNISYISQTDSDGYYELVLPKEAFNLKVGIFSDTYCYDTFTEEEVEVPLGLGEPMGPFTEDVVLQDYINPRTSAPLVELSGQVVNCDGSQAIWPEVEIHTIAEDGFTIIEQLAVESDGSFSYLDDECLDLPYTLKIVGKNFIDNMNSDTIETLVTNGVYTNLDMQLNTCNAILEGLSTAIMNVNGTEYIVDQVKVKLENGDLIGFQDGQSSLATFTIPNIQLGDNNEILDLQLLDWAGGFSFTAVNNTMTADVTSLSATEVTVIVTGDFNFNSSSIVNGTCTLNLKF